MNDRGIKIINRGLEERRSSTGRVRRTIRIDAEPLIIDTDPKRLGKPVADGIANHLREAIRNIAAAASPATIKARKVAARAYANGRAWAVKRYGGGRLGQLPPDQSTRLFNDSGRFADSIVANASSDGAWRVNVAGNRLDAQTAGEAGVERIWNRLVQLVPEFANVSLLFETNSILRKTVERVSQERMKVGRMTDRALAHFQAFAALHLRTGTDD